MRISDWSSDVCSSDLLQGKPRGSFRRHQPERLLRRLRLRIPRRADVHGGPPGSSQLEHWPVSCGQSSRSTAMGPGAVAELRQRFRSEEHTSELQSLMRISYAVFCLKKKKKTQETQTYNNKERQQKTKKQ